MSWRHFGNAWERHFWKKYPFRNISIISMSFLKNRIFGKWVSVISWMTLTQFPKKNFSKIHDHITRKKVWIFFPEMTLTHFPKSDFLNLTWIFFPRMTLTHFPTFGFFFQDSRIGVKGHYKFNFSFQTRLLRTDSFLDSRLESLEGCINDGNN